MEMKIGPQKKRKKKKQKRKREKKETKLENRKGWLNSVPSASFNPFVLDVWIEYESRKIKREREKMFSRRWNRQSCRG